MNENRIAAISHDDYVIWFKEYSRRIDGYWSICFDTLNIL